LLDRFAVVVRPVHDEAPYCIRARQHVRLTTNPPIKIRQLVRRELQMDALRADEGASFYETRYRTRVVENLHRHAKAFGFAMRAL
jgi:hypothetical protein